MSDLPPRPYVTDWMPIRAAMGVIGYIAEVRPGDWHAQTKQRGEVSGCHPSSEAAAAALRAHIREASA